ncbi:MAG: hypothetical protein U9N51_03330 [Bacteroidota bacterium]|nr:hypothetical protein [Bacteroidota bacterium]
MLKLILLSIVILSFVFLGLGIKIFFSKKKAFPDTHIGENENMKQMGISCATAGEGGLGGCSCEIEGGKKGACHIDNV